MSRARIVLDVVLLGLLGAAALLIWRAGWLETGALPDALDRAGVWGPVLFVILYAVLCLLPLPISLVTILAGAVFGLVEGVLLVWVGAVLGAVGGWSIARSALLPAVRGLVVRDRGRILEQLSGNGIWPILLIRLLPVAPFMPVNYAAGATGVPFRPYLIGTVLGILPSSALYVQVGAAGLQDPTGLLWALFGIVVLAVLGGWRLRRRSGPGSAGYRPLR